MRQDWRPTVSLPVDWQTQVLERTKALDVSMSEYVRGLIGRDIGLVASALSRPKTRTLNGFTYPIEFDVSGALENQLRGLAELHEISLSSVVLALIYKYVPNLPVKPVMRKFNKDLWTRTQMKSPTEKCRIKLSVPSEWDTTLDAWAKETTGNPHAKQAGAVRGLIERVLQTDAQQS